MNRSKSKPLEIGVVAIAWGQLFVILTIVDKSQLQTFTFSGFIRLFNSNPFFLFWDWKQLGWIPVALNLIAIAVLTIVLLCWNPSIRKSPSMEKIDALHIKRFGAFGTTLWVLSFLSFLAYLNIRLSILVFCTGLASLGYLAFSEIRAKRIKK